jgi:hypothetical protein
VTQERDEGVPCVQWQKNIWLTEPLSVATARPSHDLAPSPDACHRRSARPATPSTATDRGALGHEDNAFMNEQEMPWPRTGQHLIRQGQDPATSAILNDWAGSTDRRHRHYRLVSGYEEAAERQYNAMTSGHDLDTGVFPLVTMWRQALELRMKWVLRELQQLHDLAVDVPTHHNLAKMWNTLRPLLHQTSPQEPPEQIKSVGRMIGELHAIDASATEFRYATRPDGTPTLDGVESLDLPALQAGMAALVAFFAAASDQADHLLELKDDKNTIGVIKPACNTSGASRNTVRLCR